MEKKSRFKVIVRPGKTVMKLALLGILVLSTVALIALHSHIAAKEERNQDLKAQALALEKENQKLEQYSEDQDTDEGIRQVAKEEQGMVDPDTVIYDFG